MPNESAGIPSAKVLIEYSGQQEDQTDVQNWRVSDCQKRCDSYYDKVIPGRQCLSIEMFSYTKDWNRNMGSCTLYVTAGPEWDEDWLRKNQDFNRMVCKRENQGPTTTRPPKSTPNFQLCKRICVDTLSTKDKWTSIQPIDRDLAVNMCTSVCDVKDASVCWPKARDMLARNHRAGQEPTYCEFADHLPYHKPSWYDCKKDCVKLLHDNRKDTGNYFKTPEREGQACAGWCWNKPEDCYAKANPVVSGRPDAEYNYNVNPVFCNRAEPHPPSQKRNLLSSNPQYV